MNKIPSPGFLTMSATVAILTATPALARAKNPDKNACYGEMHLHTTWPFED